MLSQELLKKVRRIEMTTRKAVDDVLTGNYKSHFKGQGVLFSEHRLYVAGDDVRHIDWKASARSRDPVIKKFDEERELTVFIVVDFSASENFGTSHRLKAELAAEVGGMLSYAAVHTGDKVGLLIFSGEVEKIIPPKKGRSHVQRIMTELLTFKTEKKGTNLKDALDAAGRVMKHRGIVFILSDFKADSYELSLKRLARRHDVVAISLSDERERELPALGPIVFCDPETGEEAVVNTSSYLFRKWFEENQKKFDDHLQKTLKTSQVERLKIQTKDDYAEAVVQFFRARSFKR